MEGLKHENDFLLLQRQRNQRIQQSVLTAQQSTGIRTAKWKANESKVNEIEDVSLVELGEFDTETGEMYGADPKQLCSLTDLKEKFDVKS